MPEGTAHSALATADQKRKAISAHLKSISRDSIPHMPHGDNILSGITFLDTKYAAFKNQISSDRPEQDITTASDYLASDPKSGLDHTQILFASRGASAIGTVLILSSKKHCAMDQSDFLSMLESSKVWFEAASSWIGFVLPEDNEERCSVEYEKEQAIFRFEYQKGLMEPLLAEGEQPSQEMGANHSS